MEARTAGLLEVAQRIASMLARPRVRWLGWSAQMAHRRLGFGRAVIQLKPPPALSPLRAPCSQGAFAQRATMDARPRGRLLSATRTLIGSASLDQDSLIAIVERLPLRERLRLEITCRALAAIVRHPSLWRKVSFVQLLAGPEMHRHPAGVPEMYDQFHVQRSLPRLTDANLRALLVRMNAPSTSRALARWLRGGAGKRARGAARRPKLRRISLHTSLRNQYRINHSSLAYPANFMDAAVVDIVKSFPALQIAHIPQQRLALKSSRNEDQRIPFAEWDQPWRDLAKYMHQKRRKDDTHSLCGFCNVRLDHGLSPGVPPPGLPPARCWECVKHSCKDQSKGCPKAGTPCVGCYRRICSECKEKMAETAARQAAAVEAIGKPKEAIKFYKKVHLFELPRRTPTWR